MFDHFTYKTKSILTFLHSETCLKRNLGIEEICLQRKNFEVLRVRNPEDPKVKAPVSNGTFLERTKDSVTCISVTVRLHYIRI